MLKLNLSKAIVNGECGANKRGKIPPCSLEVNEKGSIIEDTGAMIRNSKKNVVVDKNNKKEDVRVSTLFFGFSGPGSKGSKPTHFPVVFGGRKYVFVGFNLLQMALPSPFYFLNGTPVHMEVSFMLATDSEPPYLVLKIPVLPSSDKTPATQQLEKMINATTRASPSLKSGSFKMGISVNTSALFTRGASFYVIKPEGEKGTPQVIVGTDGSIPLSNENFVKFFKLFVPRGGLEADGSLPSYMNTWPKIERFKAKDPVSKVTIEGSKAKFSEIFINNEGINNGGNEKGSREVDERGKSTVSSKGNTYNVDYSAGDVYIDCQPVNIDEEQTNVKMEGYKLQSEMDIIPTKEKIMEYLMNPWVQGFILFLVILILFMVVKMLMAKGKTQGKADLDTGS